MMMMIMNNFIPSTVLRLLKLFLPQRKVAKLAFSAPAPPPLPGIARFSTLKILGVTVTNTLSMAKHIQNVIKSSSQTLHALRILHSHGMSATIIEHVFQAVA